MPAAGANPEDGRPGRGLTAATGDRYKWVALANTTARRPAAARAGPKKLTVTRLKPPGQSRTQLS
jgi:hypothetical protein